MEQKTYTVGFYQGVHGAGKEEMTKLSKVFKKWKVTSPPSQKSNNYTYQVRGLTKRGTYYEGIFAKFRYNDIPKIGSVANVKEIKIPLKPDQGLIEKNHFLYYPAKQVLVFQNCREAGTPNQFAKYITEATSKTAVFNPILKGDSAKRLMLGGVKPRELEVSFAMPKGVVRTQGKNKFTSNILEALGSAGGRSMTLKITLGGQSRSTSDYLNMDVKDAMQELVSITDTRTARLKVDTDEGITDTIDLIADRITASVQVKMAGKYPQTKSLFQALKDAKSDANHEIEAALG